MSKALLIARREMGAYVRSPLGSVIIAGALLIDGILFYYWGLSQKMLSAEVLSEFFYAASGITMAAASSSRCASSPKSARRTRSPCSTRRPYATGRSCSASTCRRSAMLALLTALTLYMPALIFVNGKVSIGHIAVGYLGLLLDRLGDDLRSASSRRP